MRRWDSGGAFDSDLYARDRSRMAKTATGFGSREPGPAHLAGRAMKTLPQGDIGRVRFVIRSQDLHGHRHWGVKADHQSFSLPENREKCSG